MSLRWHRASYDLDMSTTTRSSRVLAALIGSVAIVALAACGSSPTPSPLPSKSGTPAPTLLPLSNPTSGSEAAEEAFSVALLQQLVASAGHGNVVDSPSSADAFLTMLELGAQGATQTQIAKALGTVSLTPAQSGVLWRNLDSTVAQEAVASHITLSTADSLWLQEGLPLTPTFLSEMATNFGAKPTSVDFETDPAAAISTINTWVDQKTKGMIPTLFHSGQITPATRVVIADAVYFDAHWASQFLPSETALANFSTPEGTVSTPFMNQSLRANWETTSTGATVLDLPYQNNGFEAVFVMPREGQTLAQFVAQLTPGELASYGSSSLPSSQVDLTLPKFDLTDDMTLNSTLKSMGITDVFNPQSANLDGMANGGLYLDVVVQNAKIEVNEQGTKAAAATGGGVAGAIAVQTTPITFDRPFLMVVRSTKTGAILFTSTVNNPQG